MIGTLCGAGFGRCTFEDAFQIMIMVLVETAERHRPLGALQLIVGLYHDSAGVGHGYMGFI